MAGKGGVLEGAVPSCEWKWHTLKRRVGAGSDTQEGSGSENQGQGKGPEPSAVRQALPGAGSSSVGKALGSLSRGRWLLQTFPREKGEQS